MSYKVEFIPEAVQDYKKLVNKKMNELSEKPLLGELLGNKHKLDLTGSIRLMLQIRVLGLYTDLYLRHKLK